MYESYSYTVQYYSAGLSLVVYSVTLRDGKQAYVAPEELRLDDPLPAILR